MQSVRAAKNSRVGVESGKQVGYDKRSDKRGRGKANCERSRRARTDGKGTRGLPRTQGGTHVTKGAENCETKQELASHAWSKDPSGPDRWRPRVTWRRKECKKRKKAEPRRKRMTDPLTTGQGSGARG